MTVPASFEELLKGPVLVKFFKELGVHTLARPKELCVQWLGFLCLLYVHIPLLALQHKVG